MSDVDPEEEATLAIDTLLEKAGWSVTDLSQFNIQTCHGAAIREFPLARSLGFADYLLYVQDKAGYIATGLDQ